MRTFQRLPDHPVTPAALLSQHIDEAALLFATGQPDAAISLLQSAVAQLTPSAPELEQRAWWMLLELQQAMNRPTEFDRIALAYAQRFEASPPQWRATARSASTSSPPAISARSASTAATTTAAGMAGTSTGTLMLRGMLDAGTHSQLSSWRQRHPDATELMLDLSHATAINLAGCNALLSMLAQCQQQRMRVRLYHGDLLLSLLRELIQAGRRDADDAGWRLLIELLWLTGDTERYEDACLAYSLTYEVSPPSALAPAISGNADGGALTMALPRRELPYAARATFMLPASIALPIDSLLADLRTHVARHATARVLVLDASRLLHIEFHAASPLQRALTQLAAGKTVEWREVSFLVSTLLQLTGDSAVPRIINRRP